MERSEFFGGIAQVDVKVGSYEARYPIFYRELAYLGIFLPASLEKLKGMLPSPRMHPYRLTPWHGVITITASEYKDSDVGPYNQVSVGVPFVLDRPSPVFTGILRQLPVTPLIYTLYLPVTTERARAAGEAIANYPEFLADIRFENKDQWTSCSVDAGGKNIVRLSGRHIDLEHTPRQRVCPITCKDGNLLRSEFLFDECRAGTSRHQSDVHLEFGDHPIGMTLKSLSLSRVLQYQYTPSVQAILSMVTESIPL